MADDLNSYLIKESVKAAMANQADEDTKEDASQPQEVISSLVVPSGSKTSLRCYKQINLATYRNNIRSIQAMAEKTKCDMIAVLKADAYGHNAPRLALECLKMGIKAFAVATVIEAIELRRSNVKLMADNVKIIVLGVSTVDEFPLFVEYRLDLMASGVDMVESLLAWGKQRKDDKSVAVNVHCMMDTGMSRIGFDIDDCLSSIHSMAKNGKDYGLKFVGLCTHFAQSEDNKEYTLLQFERFTSVLKQLEADGINVEMFHCENSNSLMIDVIDDETVQSYMDHDTKGFVRIGGAMYEKTLAKTGYVMSLYAQIRHLDEVKTGESVGYDRLFKAEEDTTIATLSIGYADGYPRGMSEKKQCIRIGDYLYDVAGKVCMDMMMVNLGNKEKNPQIKDIKVGDYAVLFGPKSEHAKNLDLVTMSEMLGSFYSEWEITCGLTKRCPAVFVDDDEE